MGNRKSVEKLKIPSWYSLASYREMRSLDSPLKWLDQLALRIDMRRLLDRLSKEAALGVEGNCGFSERKLMQELFRALCTRPIADSRQIVKQFRESNCSINFQTHDSVSDGYEPVWNMSLRDFYLAECFVHPDKREWCRKYFQQVEKAAPFPASELTHLRTDEFLRSNREFMGHLMNGVLSRHRTALLESLSSQAQINPPYLEHENPFTYGQGLWFMEEYISRDTPEESNEYFVVDTSVPYKEAERAFRKLYEQSRKKGGNNKLINNSAFAKWCDDGVLPYIDLKMYEAIEVIRSGNRRLAFTEADLAAAIYEQLPGRLQRDPSAISDITKPIADSLMNPDGGHFKLLLIEQTRREHQRADEELECERLVNSGEI